MQLITRIEKLEECIRPRYQEATELTIGDCQRLQARFDEILANAKREETLRLEERLAIARRNAQRDQVEVTVSRSVEFYQRWDAVRIRQLEIALLECDGDVGGEAARELHENASAHLRFGAALLPLPQAGRQEDRPPSSHKTYTLAGPA